MNVQAAFRRHSEVGKHNKANEPLTYVYCQKSQKTILELRPAEKRCTACCQMNLVRQSQTQQFLSTTTRTLGYWRVLSYPAILKVPANNNAVINIS